MLGLNDLRLVSWRYNKVGLINSDINHLAKKRVILCADDYGLNGEVSRAIINLANKNRISAISCMTNFSHFSEFGLWLRPLVNELDLGLHFNLTTGCAIKTGLSFTSRITEHYPSLAKILLMSYLRALKPREIENELNAQLDKFEEVIGVVPDYIDGERHVHHFPVIQDAIIRVIKARLPKKTYVRSVLNMQGTANDFFKAKVIQYSGARSMQNKLRAQGIAYNKSFSGIYDFQKAENIAEYFRGFLSSVTDRGMIYCHPGLAASDTNDPLIQSRTEEYAYLMSDGFIADLGIYKVVLSRFY